jgi:hypothetical protein
MLGHKVPNDELAKLREEMARLVEGMVQLIKTAVRSTFLHSYTISMKRFSESSKTEYLLRCRLELVCP